MEISIIACTCKNNVIGINNTIPWDFPEDLKFFKEKTMYNPIIMGKNTYLSIGHPLVDRLNIVISSSLKDDRVLIFKTLNDAIDYLKLHEFNHCFIIGGETLYKESFKYANSVYLTRINKKFKGDTFFPSIPKIFKIVNLSKLRTWQFEAAFIKYTKCEKFNVFKYILNRLRFYLLYLLL